MRIDTRWAGAYFAAQAVGGAVWWALVLTMPAVRTATLGALDPVAVALADVPLFVVGSGLAAAGVRGAALVAGGWTVLVAVALTVYGLVTGQAGWGVLVMAAAAAGSLLAVLVLRLGRVPGEWLVRGPFGFRSARAGLSTAGILGRTAAMIVLFWGFFLGVVPVLIAWGEARLGVGMAPSDPGVRAAMVVVGAVLLVLVGSLGIVSAVLMGTRGAGTPLPMAMPQRLVIAGPYRWVRNPMAIAGIGQAAAVGLMLSSWLVVGYALVGAVTWHTLVRPQEEADLVRRFGDEYEWYRRAVRCWLPRRHPYRASEVRPAARPFGRGQSSV